VLTIGYLITEADTVEVTDSDGATIPASSWLRHARDSGWCGRWRASPETDSHRHLGADLAARPPHDRHRRGGTDRLDRDRGGARKFAGYWDTSSTERSSPPRGLDTVRARQQEASSSAWALSS